ncbi:MAG: hypothetical protein WAU10_19925, partial [Caldilineaceae bacterium]
TGFPVTRLFRPVRSPSLPVPLHEPIHPLQRLLNVLFDGHIIRNDLCFQIRRTADLPSDAFIRLLFFRRSRWGVGWPESQFHLTTTSLAVTGSVAISGIPIQFERTNTLFCHCISWVQC